MQAKSIVFEDAAGKEQQRMRMSQSLSGAATQKEQFGKARPYSTMQNFRGEPRSLSAKSLKITKPVPYKFDER